MRAALAASSSFTGLLGIGSARRGAAACATSAVPGHCSCAAAGVAVMAKQAKQPSVLAMRYTIMPPRALQCRALAARRELRTAYARLRAHNASEAAPELRRQKSPGTLATARTRCAARSVEACLVCSRSLAVGQLRANPPAPPPDAVGRCARLAPDHVHFMAGVRPPEGRDCVISRQTVTA